MDLKKYILNVSDFPKKGIEFKDITSLLKDKRAFRKVIDLFYDDIDINKFEFDYVVGIDARGFLFAAPLAYKLNKGFIPIRKKDKLPRETINKKIITEYSYDEISIHKDDIESGSKVILIDDLLATGGSIEASIKLLEELNISIVKIYFLIELDDLNGRRKIGNYKVLSLINY